MLETLFSVSNKLEVISKMLLIIGLFLPLDNPNHIVINKPVLKSYDFIIIGGGSAGSVLASRLSEDPHNSVLLLEAGPAGTSFSEWPIQTAYAFNDKRYNWMFSNVPDDGYCVGLKDQTCKLARGKMLGGSSALGLMMYVRGNRNDYDQWEKLGNAGWGYRDVLPYFTRAEHNTSPHLRISAYHGVGGPVPVSSPRYLSDLAPLWLRAAHYLGFSLGDVNGHTQSRFMHHQSTAKHGERWSTSRAYLKPASHRHNLNIRVHAHVTRIIIDPRTDRAKGVVFFHKKKRQVVWARKEVILSAGAFQSPQLLKLSGVGPCHELNKFGITCIRDLPGVGENMQSHVGLGGVDFTTKDALGITLPLLWSLASAASYLKHRSGPLATASIVEGVGFVSSPLNNISYGQDWPDLQLLFFPMQLATDGGIFYREIYGIGKKLWQQFAKLSFQPGFRIVPVILRPRSRGRVLLRSRNAFQHPDIFLNLFDDERDVAVLREGGRLAERLGLAPPFLRIGASLNSEPNPFCYRHPAGGPDWWSCRVRVHSQTAYDDTSTCAMGPPDDRYAVVDNQLRVYGVTGLRVVDASIMPRITSGNTGAATVMIAEKAADLIKAYWHARYLSKDPATYVAEHVLHVHKGRPYDLPLHGDHDWHVDGHVGGHVDGYTDEHVDENANEHVDEHVDEHVNDPLDEYRKESTVKRDGGRAFHGAADSLLDGHNRLNASNSYIGLQSEEASLAHLYDLLEADGLYGGKRPGS